MCLHIFMSYVCSWHNRVALTPAGHSSCLTSELVLTTGEIKALEVQKPREPLWHVQHQFLMQSHTTVSKKATSIGRFGNDGLKQNICKCISWYFVTMYCCNLFIDDIQNQSIILFSWWINLVDKVWEDCSDCLFCMIWLFFFFKKMTNDLSNIKIVAA